MRASLALAALLALTAEVSPAMTHAAPEPPKALSLKVERHGTKLAVELVGRAPSAVEVSYELEVSGRSTSRHRGRTTLAAGTTARLSTMTAEVGDTWCVRLLAEEEGREPYEIREGDCPDGD
ncbi:MAG: hypothetical protein GC147_07370 [Porphyrobacter sp.]|nr:hypothetical protein [Porphyrobacter sp.]